MVTGEAGRCIFVTVSQFVAAIAAPRDSAPPDKMSGLTHLESSSSERLQAAAVCIPLATLPHSLRLPDNTRLSLEQLELAFSQYILGKN